MAKIDVVCPRCSETQGVIRNGYSSSGEQRYRCNQCLKTFQLKHRYNGAADKPQHSSPSPKKLASYQVAQHVEAGAEVVICCEVDEQWSYVRCEGNQRWLFYAYDRIRKRVLAHVFEPPNALTLQRVLVLLSQFNIAFYMTDAWPVYRTLLASTSHAISKKYTQRIERRNLNLRIHFKRLARRTICFSK